MIYVDVREKRSLVPYELKKLGVKIAYLELEVGDYVVGDVGVERKEINDFVSSLVSGRLDNELYNLSYNFDLSYLIVEGYISEALLYRKIKRWAYISKLVGCSLKKAPEGRKGQIITVNLESPFDTALFLKALDEKLTRGEVFRLPSLKKASLGDEERALAILMALPGVGEKRARLLLERFGSVRRVFEASLEELVSIKGLGKSGAEAIFNLVNKRFPPSERPGLARKGGVKNGEVGGEI